LPQDFDRVSDSVVVAVVDLSHIAEVDQALGALDARQVRDEHDLLQKSRRVAVDDGVFLGMEAAAIAWLVPVAAIVLAVGYNGNATGLHFPKIRGRNDGTHGEPMARRPMREGLGKC